MSNNIVAQFNVIQKFPNLWTPALISTSAWYDASDESTITTDVGVSQWDDKSGNSNDATQAVGANQPTTGNDYNGLNSLYFSGGNDYLLSTLEQLTTVTIFAVLEPEQKGVNLASLYLTTSTAFDSGGCYAETEVYATGDPKATVRYGTLLPSSQRSYNGEVAGSPSVFQKGIFGHWGTGLNTQNLDYYIGARADLWSGGFYKGKMGELIIVPSQLSEADRQKIEGYLAWKWGLESNLPVDHPYKNSAPTV
jgi:hypothetical protein